MRRINGGNPKKTFVGGNGGRELEEQRRGKSPKGRTKRKVLGVLSEEIE